jgi:hypothetical protein
MDYDLHGELRWRTDPPTPGWHLLFEEAPGQPLTLLPLGAHVPQSASQQELQTLLADAFHAYIGRIPERISLLTPVDDGQGGIAYTFTVGY